MLRSTGYFTANFLYRFLKSPSLQFTMKYERAKLKEIFLYKKNSIELLCDAC